MKFAHKQFIEYLERGHFFEAHEVIEHIWFPIRKENHPEKNILRGIINASVSFELIKRGRPQAAKRVWQTYLKYRPLIGQCTSANRQYYEAIAKTIATVYKKFEDIYG
jgi:hypothetical protein